jgi:hypothetical protein
MSGCPIDAGIKVRQVYRSSALMATLACGRVKSLARPISP